MKTKKLDVASVLDQLATIRATIPYVPPSAPTHDGHSSLLEGMEMRTAEDFEYAVLAEGLESLARDLEAALDHAHALATEKALEIYYAAEELARDPAHAELIPHVQRMREAYEREHGTPIPPKP